jgi:hypothetical protein
MVACDLCGDTKNFVEEAEQPVDQNSIEYRQRNALAWRVISELCRRDNNLFVGPKGGDDNGVALMRLWFCRPLASGIKRGGMVSVLWR